MAWDDRWIWAGTFFKGIASSRLTGFFVRISSFLSLSKYDICRGPNYLHLYITVHMYTFPTFIYFIRVLVCLPSTLHYASCLYIRAHILQTHIIPLHYYTCISQLNEGFGANTKSVCSTLCCKIEIRALWPSYRKGGEKDSSREEQGRKMARRMK